MTQAYPKDLFKVQAGPSGFNVLKYTEFTASVSESTSQITFSMSMKTCNCLKRPLKGSSLFQQCVCGGRLCFLPILRPKQHRHNWLAAEVDTRTQLFSIKPDIRFAKNVQCCRSSPQVLFCFSKQGFFFFFLQWMAILILNGLIF